MSVMLELRVDPLDREALEESLPGLLEIEHEVGEEMGDAYSHERWGPAEFRLERPEKWQLSRYARLDGQPVGFLIASRDSDSMHIHRFAVARSARGAELGAELCYFSREAARALRLRRITLSLASANARARRFYDRLGFTPLPADGLANYARGRGLELRDDGLVVVAGHSYWILERPIA